MQYPFPEIKPNVKLEGGRIDQPIQTWFFEKEGGKIIAVQEAEAWRIYSRKNQMIGQTVVQPKLIGVSSGVIYYKALVEAREVFKQYGLEKAQETIRKGMADEIEAARGNIIIPRNFDSIGRNGDAVKISELDR